MKQGAYAAYHEKFKWYPLSSIRNDPEAVEAWINKTYVSGGARAAFRVVPVVIRHAK